MTRERRIGWIIVLIVGFGALALVAVFAAREAGSLRYTVTFMDARGLHTGDRVQLSGVDIGLVKAIELPQPGHVEVLLRIDPNHAKLVRSDSTAIIRNASLPNVSGQMIVEIVNPETTPPAPPMQSGAIIKGQESLLGLKTWQLRNSLSGATESLGGVMNEAMRSLDDLAGQLKDLSNSPEVRNTLTQLRQFMLEMQQEGKAAAQRLRAEWPALKAHLQPVLEQARQMTNQFLHEGLEEIIKQIEITLDRWGEALPGASVTPAPTVSI